jgi:hypothetical protein
MSRTLLASASVLCVLAASVAGKDAVISTFDNDLEDWTAKGVDISNPLNPFLVDNSPDMVHEAAGGNPGGYARLTDAITDPGSLAYAPAKFLGDWSDFKDVGYIAFDHTIFAPGPNVGYSPYTVSVVSGPGLLNSMIWQGPTPSGPTAWEHFEVPLTLGAGGFTLSPLSTKTFDEIIADVTDLLVAFEVVDNAGDQNKEHCGLDNVILAPEPGTVSLLVLGACPWLLGLRRRAGGRRR